ncbi:MAG: hypothetical protein AAGG44_02780 [Planctomycetota bacterium]
MRLIPLKQPLRRIGVLHLTLLLASATLLQSSNAQTRRNRGDTKQGSQQTQTQEGTGSAESKTAESESETEDKDKEKAKPKQVKIGGIQWYVDYDAALKIAQKENKPMWLHFGENPG